MGGWVIGMGRLPVMQLANRMRYVVRQRSSLRIDGDVEAGGFTVAAGGYRLATVGASDRASDGVGPGVGLRTHDLALNSSRQFNLVRASWLSPPRSQQSLSWQRSQGFWREIICWSDRSPLTSNLRTQPTSCWARILAHVTALYSWARNNEHRFTEHSSL